MASISQNVHESARGSMAQKLDLLFGENNAEEPQTYFSEIRFGKDGSSFNPSYSSSPKGSPTPADSHKGLSLPIFSFPPLNDLWSGPEQSKEGIKSAEFPESVFSFDSADSKQSDESKALGKSSIESTWNMQSHKTEIESCVLPPPAKPKQKPAQDSDNIDALLDTITNTPHFKDNRFSTRRDVVNKTIFRIMKRFYVLAFKKFDPSVKPKLISSGRSTEIEAFLKSCEAYIASLEGPIAHHAELQYLIASMICKNVTDNLELSEATQETLKMVNSCLYSYSDKALRKVFGDSSAKLLFNFFFQHGQDFFNEQKSVLKNVDEYQAGLTSIFAQFNGQLCD